MFFVDVVQKHVFVPEALGAMFTLKRPLASMGTSLVPIDAESRTEGFVAVRAHFHHITNQQCLAKVQYSGTIG